MMGLNTGFFIGRNNKVIAAQGFPFPDAMMQIKESCGFLFEIRIAGPNPAAVTPGSIFAQPAPNRFPACRAIFP
ncbi:MAG: hypothetical protein RBT11_10085 [Desulfobacterales bacterium]|jgi:hypothetical protein|nr:hypothetical protein [Desulfobacterales bacterium]